MLVEIGQNLKMRYSLKHSENAMGMPHIDQHKKSPEKLISALNKNFILFENLSNICVHLSN